MTSHLERIKTSARTQTSSESSRGGRALWTHTNKPVRCRFHLGGNQQERWTYTSAMEDGMFSSTHFRSSS